jgi:proteasome accessory factor C
MDKWEKVAVLHRLLKTGKYSIPKEHILRTLECSEATFHRIRGFMQSRLGAPIEYDRKHQGYYYNETEDGPFELPGFWLTQNEIEALLCMDNAVESLQQSFFCDILAPIRNRFEPLLAPQKTSLAALRNRVKILSIGSRQCDQTVFKTAAEAVLRRKRLLIEHKDLAGDNPLQRIISPYALVRYRDNWYMDGFCHLRSGLRTFSLNRICSARFASGKFHREPEDKIRSFFAEAYGMFTGPATNTAIIDFTGIAGREVSHESWHPKQEGKWPDQNTYRLSVPYGHSRELVMDILRWGELAEVIAPVSLRREVGLIIRKMMKKYEK